MFTSPGYSVCYYKAQLLDFQSDLQAIKHSSSILYRRRWRSNIVLFDHATFHFLKFHNFPVPVMYTSSGSTYNNPYSAKCAFQMLQPSSLFLYVGVYELRVSHWSSCLIVQNSIFITFKCPPAYWKIIYLISLFMRCQNPKRPKFSIVEQSMLKFGRV